jgi:hypothetical protein
MKPHCQVGGAPPPSLVAASALGRPLRLHYKARYGQPLEPCEVCDKEVTES